VQPYASLVLASGSCSCPPYVGAGHPAKIRLLVPDGQCCGKADPMANLAARPPANRAFIYTSRYEWDDADGSSGAVRGHRSAIQVSVLLFFTLYRGWPGRNHTSKLSYRAHAITVAGMCFPPTWSSCRWPSTRSAGPGFTVTSYFAPTARSAVPASSATWSTRLHQADRLVSSTGCRPTSRATNGPGPVRRHPAVRAPRPPRGEHPTGAASSSTTADRGPQLPGCHAVYWLEEIPRDGLLWTRWRPCPPDYSRTAGEWVPNAPGGRGTTDAVALIQEVNST